jgi:hypothetical protein
MTILILWYCVAKPSIIFHRTQFYLTIIMSSNLYRTQFYLTIIMSSNLYRTQFYLTIIMSSNINLCSLIYKKRTCVVLLITIASANPNFPGKKWMTYLLKRLSLGQNYLRGSVKSRKRFEVLLNQREINTTRERL